jgi:biopolymer transport protein ExbD
MAVRFRCIYCQGLMSISSRRIGAIVACPTCGADVLVPAVDIFEAASEFPGPQAADPDLEDILFDEVPPEDDAPDLEHHLHADTDKARPLFDVWRNGENAAAAPPDPAEPDPEIQSSTQPEVADNSAADEPPEFRLRRARSEFDDLDMTPMVDVVFLLLIFFMVTASFSLQKSIEVPSPDPDRQGATQSIQSLNDLQDTSIIVEVDDKNVIFVDEERIADPDRLADTFRDKMRLEQKTELVISPDPTARHRTVISVIDAANEVGMQKIRLARGGTATRR